MQQPPDESTRRDPDGDALDGARERGPGELDPLHPPDEPRRGNLDPVNAPQDYADPWRGRRLAFAVVAIIVLAVIVYLLVG